MTRKGYDSWQGFFGFIAITLGVIPLVQFALGGRRGGLLRLVLGDDPGAALWVVPGTVLAVAAIAILLLERGKTRATR